jgi:hypothetical protein
MLRGHRPHADADPSSSQGPYKIPSEDNNDQTKKVSSKYNAKAGPGMYGLVICVPQCDATAS